MLPKYLLYSSFVLGIVNVTSFNHVSPERLAYFAFRYDHKARVEANAFQRHYGRNSICECCAAAKPAKKGDDSMNYTNFRSDGLRYLTSMSHQSYVDTSATVSPWIDMEGWTVRTCTHDLMHTIYLGVGRDLVGSLLADMMDVGALDPAHGPLDEQLRVLSVDMHNVFREARRNPQIFQKISNKSCCDITIRAPLIPIVG